RQVSSNPVDSQPFETFRSSVSGRSETCPELRTTMAALTLRLPNSLESRLRRYAEVRGRTKSDVARAALEADLDEPNTEPGAATAFELMRKHIGSVEGPSDLSTNPAHLTGYGRRAVH
ncbi:MAG: hypothetical protein CO096_30325, partial [Armatimonadetes bacterium CG_4_9_14_3_um_filter_66_14]